MWENFKVMPLFMKLLAVHGSMFLVGAFLSLFPIGRFSVGGQQVTYSEWWSSGTGIKFLVVALSIGVGAICLIKKVRYARTIYFVVLLGIFAVLPVTDPVLLGRVAWFIPVAVFIGLIYWYLFHKKTVQVYFGVSNP